MSSSWTSDPQPQVSSEQRAKKLRHACNSCHRAKVKCSRGTPCAGCAASGDRCVYSESNRAGRPRGTKNKRTLDLMNANAASNSSERSRSRTPSDPQPPMSSAMNSGMSTPALMSGMPTPNISPEMVNNLSFLDSRDAFWTFGGPGTGFDDFPTDALLDASSALNTSTSHMFGNDPILSHDFDKNPLGLFSHTDLTVDYFSLPLTPSSTSSPSSNSSKCSCLNHHAKLLVRLKTLWQATTPPPIDVVLDGVKQVLEPWKQFIQCHICQPDEDQEALLLSAMSFRVVLRLLQRVCNRSTEFDAFFDDGTAGLRVGNYDITGDEQNLVLDLLVSQTLGKIQFAIECLKERSTQQKLGGLDIQMHGAGADNREGTPDADYVQQLLGNLESTVQLLHRGLKSNNLMSMDGMGV
ncbi:uncharacterized protein LY89DRAFT_227318 [Mollisia scopiformis]|uniref:Zn(2)-C6 fungal-type domain-containing protein n=1 Tax=Mollisia scopiformis TaxID=149040 RepID=A0A194WUC4_MOLSC|nr:uncharacterized protein LY89DRAFT_227318 [Mollisia scopiformis]KUJ11560.1 hypothetical protein LY89DRAFT_227318 [Mollisia scopiformis]